MHLSSSHQMFPHGTTALFFGFLNPYRRKILSQYYYIRKIIADLFDVPLHRSTPYWGLLDKKIFFAFTVLKVGMSMLKTLTIC